MDAYLGTILPWAPNFEPRGWLFCDGRELSIRDHTAVFSLLGTMYGGNGQTTFRLPDLRGRLPIGTSNDIQQGEICYGADPTKSPAVQLAGAPADGKPAAPSTTITTPAVPQALGVKYIICVEGIFPSRW